MVRSDWFAVGPFSKSYNKGVVISYKLCYIKEKCASTICQWIICYLVLTYWHLEQNKFFSLHAFFQDKTILYVQKAKANWSLLSYSEVLQLQKERRSDCCKLKVMFLCWIIKLVPTSVVQFWSWPSCIMTYEVWGDSKNVLLGVALKMKPYKTYESLWPFKIFSSKACKLVSPCETDYDK